MTRQKRSLPVPHHIICPGPHLETLLARLNEKYTLKVQLYYLKFVFYFRLAQVNFVNLILYLIEKTLENATHTERLQLCKNLKRIK